MAGENQSHNSSLRCPANSRRSAQVSLRMIAAATVGMALLSPIGAAHPASGYLKPDVSERVLKKAESRFQDGVEEYQQHNHRAALRKFMSAETACPELFSAGYHVALAHRKMGNEEAAVSQLKKLNERFPENIIAHNDLGVIYAGKNKEEYDLLATAEFETGIKNGESLLLGKEKTIPQVRVDLAMAYANLGALQFENSRLTEAEKSFRRATEHYPRAFFAHFGLGNALFAMGKFTEAKNAYLKSQEIEPKNPNVRIGLAKCYLSERDKNPRFALSELRKAVGSNPTAEVFGLLGDAHALLGNLQEAIKSYERSLELPGQDVQVLYKLGAVHYNNKKRDEAKKYLEKFVGEAPKESESSLSMAHKLLGDIASEGKDYEKAIAHYLQATKLRDKYWSCYYGLAESCFHLGRYDEAREYLRLIFDGLPEKGRAEENELREKASALFAKIPSQK